MPLRILLLQARRADDPAREDERRSFAAKALLPVEHFVAHDLLTGPPSMQKVHTCDALMVGGSGDFYVSKQNLPQFPALMEFFNEVVTIGLPILASCFGFHLLAKALGGEVVHDLESMEVGTFELTLSDAGTNDELFSCLPRQFRAQLGHKDRAAELSDKCVTLASSQRVPCQAFRVHGYPVWATQFHPELDVEENRQRFRQYIEGYATFMSVEQREATLRQFRDSPETHGLIRRFLEINFG
jgi:GMP synthase (glutamine-hydrolysing)